MQEAEAKCKKRADAEAAAAAAEVEKRREEAEYWRDCEQRARDEKMEVHRELVQARTDAETMYHNQLVPAQVRAPYDSSHPGTYSASSSEARRKRCKKGFVRGPMGAFADRSACAGGGGVAAHCARVCTSQGGGARRADEGHDGAPRDRDGGARGRAAGARQRE